MGDSRLYSNTCESSASNRDVWRNSMAESDRVDEAEKHREVADLLLWVLDFEHSELRSI